MTSPRVTVITPTRDRRELLSETVASVLRQDMPDWQMVVVDDASQDDTWGWLQGADDPRIEPVRLESHLERSAARNHGLERARGEFVLFLDDDDLLPETALSRHLSVLGRHRAAVASVGSRVFFAPDGVEILQRFVEQEISKDVWEEVLLGWVAISGVSLLRAEALRSIGGWDESFVIAEDYELWSRLARLGPVVVSPDVVLRYRVHGGQWRSPNFLELMEGVRTAAVERSQGDDRARGERALKTRERLLRIGDHAKADRHVRAMLDYVRVLRDSGPVLGSPLLDSIPTVYRPSLARILVKAMVPTALLRRVRERRRDAERGPSESFAVRLSSESDGRYGGGARLAPGESGRRGGPDAPLASASEEVAS